mgnify:CR=1 FL=1
MNKKMNVILIGVICLTTQLFSASGTSVVAFSKVSPSARASGMAEAFVGLADDSSAIWYNPAGLTKISKLSVGGTYGMLFEGLNFQYVSVAYPMNIGVVGGSIVMTDYGSIKGYDALGNPTEDFSAKDMMLSGGFAYKLQPNLSIAAVAKFVHSTIEKKSNSTISLDAGVMYVLDANTSLGLVLKNVIGSIKYDEKSSNLPMLIKAGMSYNVGHVIGTDDILMLLADITNDSEVGTVIQPAAELLYPLGTTELIVRAGYKTGGGPSGTGLTVGASVRIQHQYRVDVSYTPLGELGNAIRVGLELQF